VTAVVLGASVWLGIASAAGAWIVALVVWRGVLIGPRRALRWLLSAWVPRLAVLAAWAGAGWHVFCQRP